MQFAKRYAHGEERPLGGYVVLMSSYAVAVAGAAALVRRRNRPLPNGLSAAELGLLTVATYKASRLLAKDTVTSAIRSPFTRFEEAAGDGEVNESVPGHGLSHAIGELVTCPFCLGIWVATTLAFGLVLAPKTTRYVTAMLTAAAGSDYLHVFYTAIKQRA